MAEYVERLEVQNRQLEEEYAASYDLKEVEEAALAMGMIPAAEAEHTTIHIAVAQPQPEVTFWDQIGTFFSGLFA